MLNEKDKLVLKEIMDPSIWRPSVSIVSKRLNLPISSVSDKIKKLMEIITIDVRQKDLNEMIEETGENDGNN